MTTLVRGKRLYEDDDYLLIKTVPFGIHHWLLGGFYVGLKDRDAIVKATWGEKAFLLAVMGEFAKRGIRPPDERFDELFLRFSEAVTIRGGMRWRMFFNQRAELAAIEYLGHPDS